MVQDFVRSGDLAALGDSAAAAGNDNDDDGDRAGGGGAANVRAGFFSGIDSLLAGNSALSRSVVMGIKDGDGSVEPPPPPPPPPYGEAEAFEFLKTVTGKTARPNSMISDQDREEMPWWRKAERPLDGDGTS